MDEVIPLGSLTNSLQTNPTQALHCGQSIDGEMKYSVDSKNRSDICRRVELRNHPLISYHGLPSWPPTWSPANPKSDVKSLRGEIGRLKYVLPNKTSDRCFLIIEHENEAYIGCLFFDDRIFCAQMVTILGNHAGLTVKEIGDLDLSQRSNDRNLCVFTISAFSIGRCINSLRARHETQYGFQVLWYRDGFS